MSRDENGKFTTGNKAGKKFTAGGTQAETARKGGIASGETRQERKRWREMAQLIGDETVTVEDLKRQASMSEAVLYAQFKKAMQGDTNAAKFLATILGEYIEKNETNLQADVKQQSEQEQQDDFDLLDEETQNEIVRKIQDAKHERYMREHYGSNNKRG